VAEPIRGAEEGGVPGLLRGARRGALGAVALPLASLLEMSARLADSIRRGVAGSSGLGWLRPPRHVGAAEPLQAYDWSRAMGRWLLTELDRGARGGGGGGGGGGEAFVLCVPAAERGCYLVVTARRVVYVRAKGLMWAPEVRWQAEVADLELAATVGGSLGGDGGAAMVRFVAGTPPTALRPRLRARAAAAPPLSFLCVGCADGGAAAAVAGAVRALMAATPRRVAVAGHAMVISA
jgi:hypothetical protein